MPKLLLASMVIAEADSKVVAVAVVVVGLAVVVASVSKVVVVAEAAARVVAARMEVAAELVAAEEVQLDEVVVAEARVMFLVLAALVIELVAELVATVEEVLLAVLEVVMTFMDAVESAGMPAIVVVPHCKYSAYITSSLLNPWKHCVQMLFPASEYVPTPHVKQSPELEAPAIMQTGIPSERIRYANHL